LTDNEKQRPNAEYNLSRPSAPRGSEESLNFRYSRERRLENAPQEVKDLYKENKPNRFGLLGPLIADRPRRMLFLIIILLCLTILILSMFGYLDKSLSFAGNQLEIKGTHYEGTTIIVIKKTAKNDDAYTGRVEITVSPKIKEKDEQYPEYKHSIDFSMEKEEVYRFAAPFDADELVMVLQSDKGNLQLSFKPE